MERICTECGEIDDPCYEDDFIHPAYCPLSVWRIKEVKQAIKKEKGE